MDGNRPVQVAVISDDEAFQREVGRLLRKTADLSLAVRIRTTAEARAASAAEVIIIGPLSGGALMSVLPEAVLGVVTVGTAAETTRAVTAAGARAVLGERWTKGQLRAAIRAVAAGLHVYDDDSHAGGPWPAPPPPGDPEAPLRGASGIRAAPISPREHEIIEAVAAGFTNGQIAAARGLSVNTVKFHLQSLFEKLDVHSRSQLVAEALRRGLITL
jgi:DNA-binding NarL/FixJ family response regulator